MKKALLLGMIVILSTMVHGVDMVDFDIRKGWNLVSTDVLENIENQLIEDQDLYIYYLNPRTKEYVGGSMDETIEGLSDLTQADYHMGGWWLYSEKTFDVDFQVRDKELIERHRSVVERAQTNLVRGWNFFGINMLSVGLSANELFSECDVDSVYIFELGQFRKQRSSDLNEEIPIGAVGHVYVVKTNNNCHINFEGKAPVAPPPLPQ